MPFHQSNVLYTIVYHFQQVNVQINCKLVTKALYINIQHTKSSNNMVSSNHKAVIAKGGGGGAPGMENTLLLVVAHNPQQHFSVLQMAD